METVENGLPRQNFGLPTLNLDNCHDGIPSDWSITEVFGDILMCKYIDENKTGEVLRDGIWLNKDITRNIWRVVEVLKVGPGVQYNVKEGDFLMIPGDRGLPGIGKNGEKIIFINMERAFAKVIKA